MPSVICSVCQCEINLELGHLAAAACGHTFHSSCLNQWLQKGSKTCPVCRKATKSSLALFIDFAPDDQTNTNGGSSSDVLRCRVESLEFQLKLKEEEKRKAEEKAIILEQNKKDLRLEAKRLENQYKAELDKRRSLESQLQYVTKELSTSTGFRDEAQRLRAQLETLKSAKLLIQGTEEDVEDIMSSYTNKSDEMRSLATYCVMLKRELIKSQESKGTRMVELNNCQKENSVIRGRLRVAEKRIEELENDFCRLDAENIKLMKKIDELRGKRRSVVANRLNESVNSEDLNQSVVDLQERKKKRSSDENYSPATAVLEEPSNTRRPQLQPVYEEDCNLEYTSSQPTSSQGSSGSDPSKKKCIPTPSLSSGSQSSSKSDIDLNHLSIMRKRPVLSAVSPKKNRESDVGFDGLGGSSRPDVFPNPKGPKAMLKSVKIKSGNKVKVAKITDFITLE